MTVPVFDRLRPSARALVLDSALALVLTFGTWWIMVSAPRFVHRFGSPLFVPRFPVGPPPHLPHAVAPPSALAFLLVAACFLPLALRRRYPVGVLVVVTLASVAFSIVGPESVPVLIAVLIALYTVGSVCDRRVLAIAGGLSGLVFVGVSLPSPASAVFVAELVRVSASLLAAAFLGDATRNRRAYVAEVEERAADAERTREEEALRRVDEERLHIARELHDVTAHSLSLIAVQSGAALHVMDSRPEEARKSLGTIRDTSRSALNELRAMLGVLRGQGAPDAPYAPVPGLAHLTELARPLQDAGLEVTLDVRGDLAVVPAVVDASAYRVVQEALTNVLRHAGPAHVVVSVRATSDALSLSVADDGVGAQVATGSSERHGIAGMRERVAALGGEVVAGPAKGGGWTVSAEIPLGGVTQ